MIALVPNSWGSDLREYNKCHSKEDGQFCSGTTDSNEPDHFFHPDHDAGGPDWVYPATTHKMVRDDGGLWGSSHGISSGMTGHAAQYMGIPGWRPPYEGMTSRASRAAEAFLGHIAESPGSEEPLYHGFQNTRDIDFKVGDTLRLPLLATAGSRDTVSYGIRMEQKDQEGEPTLFAFPKGTQMVAYSKWRKHDPDGDASDFKHVYSEAIVAGGYRVTKVTRAMYPYNAHWDGKGGNVPVKVVYLEQTETFHPTKGWVPRG